MGCGDPVQLAALVGPARAKLILMAGARLDTAQALSCALVDSVVSGEHLDAKVAELSGDALAASFGHIASIIRLTSSPAPRA